MCHGFQYQRGTTITSISPVPYFRFLDRQGMARTEDVSRKDG